MAPLFREKELTYSVILKGGLAAFALLGFSACTVHHHGEDHAHGASTHSHDEDAGDIFEDAIVGEEVDCSTSDICDDFFDEAHHDDEDHHHDDEDGHHDN